MGSFFVFFLIQEGPHTLPGHKVLTGDNRLFHLDEEVFRLYCENKRFCLSCAEFYAFKMNKVEPRPSKLESINFIAVDQDYIPTEITHPEEHRQRRFVIGLCWPNFIRAVGKIYKYVCEMSKQDALLFEGFESAGSKTKFVRI